MAEDKILSGAEEVARHLRIHPNTLVRYARDFPPAGAGFPAHLNGRWHVKASRAEAWMEYVKSELGRHPEMRRMRPAEPPELSAIQGRAEPEVDARPLRGGRRRAVPVPAGDGDDT